MKHKCIYCGIDKDLSESDIIPDALTNARVLNKNVCRIKHNNRFSDMFESEVIEALGFITNELDIKSSKGKKYAEYDATITIEGVDYNLKLHGENEIFNGKVLKSSDNTHMISSYDRALKIAKDESKVEMLDVNMIEIEKKVRINNGIFFEILMYRMLSKIAFEWYCAKNDVSDHYNEFDDIVGFITTGNGINPVSIVQEEALYEINKTLMKMFNMIGIGERAGSGIPDIYQVWENEGWPMPVVEESYNPDRTRLSLEFVKKQTIKTNDKKQTTKTESHREKIREFLTQTELATANVVM